MLTHFKSPGTKRDPSIIILFYGGGRKMKSRKHSLIVSVFMVLFSGLGSEPATAQTGDPVLVGAGDISSCSRTEDEATARLLDSIPGTVVTLGDNVYPDGK